MLSANLVDRNPKSNSLNITITAVLILKYYYSARRLSGSARRLIGSRIIESAAYCNQKLLAHLYLNSTQNTLVN
jgi:hypothetical protein